VSIIRLNKYLSDSGVASRRKAEQLILDGKITVNDETVSQLGTKIDTEKDEVKYEGEIVKGQDERIVIKLNKPVGYTCTTRNFKGEKNILELIDRDERLYPVGRLDKNSEGLIILTNDGDLALKLSHPRFEKEKEYEVTVDKEINSNQMDNLRKGVKIETGKTRPTKLTKLGLKKFAIVLKEGKKRQLREMCQVLGLRVVVLKRIRINNLELGDLAIGKSEELDQKQIQKLV
jgi:23S rRNA pseudouridine2605 synthase